MQEMKLVQERELAAVRSELEEIKSLMKSSQNFRRHDDKSHENNETYLPPRLRNQNGRRKCKKYFRDGVAVCNH